MCGVKCGVKALETTPLCIFIFSKLELSNKKIVILVLHRWNNLNTRTTQYYSSTTRYIQHYKKYDSVPRYLASFVTRRQKAVGNRSHTFRAAPGDPLGRMTWPSMSNGIGDDVDTAVSATKHTARNASGPALRCSALSHISPPAAQKYTVNPAIPCHLVSKHEARLTFRSSQSDF